MLQEIINTENFKETVNGLFPNNTEIRKSFYNNNLTRYFKKLNTLSLNNQLDYFNKTYNSNGDYAWFIYKDKKYFTIVENIGTIKEKRYYGYINIVEK